jgi:hypothetical protein
MRDTHTKIIKPWLDLRQNLVSINTETTITRAEHLEIKHLVHCRTISLISFRLRPLNRYETDAKSSPNMQEAKFWPQCFTLGASGHIPHIMELTDRAWMIVQKAQEEARALGDRYVGTDHLLLAMLRDGESAGAWVLDDLQVSYDDVFDRMVTTA